jgi:hypothetical protein
VIHSASVGAISFQHAYRVQSLTFVVPDWCVCACVRAPASHTCVHVHIASIYTTTCVPVRIYIMSEFQISAADTFLRRSRSRGQLLWKAWPTRVVHYIRPDFDAEFLFCRARKMLANNTATDAHGGAFMKRCGRLIRENFYGDRLSFRCASQNVFPKCCYAPLIVMWSENIFLRKMSIFQ